MLRVLLIFRLQALARGCIVRKQYAVKREEFRKIQEEKKKIWAATKIQVH